MVSVNGTTVRPISVATVDLISHMAVYTLIVGICYNLLV